MMSHNPDTRTLALLMDVRLPVQIALGRTRLPLGDLLRLGPGSVIELDGEASSTVELIVHDRVVARGEIVDANGDYGIRILSTVAPDAGVEGVAVVSVSHGGLE